MMKCFVNLALLMLCGINFTVNAQSNYYMNFPGDGSYVDLDLNDFTPPWSIECKINKNGNTPFSHLLTGSDGGSGVRLEQWYDNNQVGITDYGVADYFFGYQLSPGIWKHLAVTCDGTSTRLYINGTLQGTISASINCPADLLGLDNTQGALNAKIDELRFWNTTLSQSTISTYQDSSANSNHPNYSSLVGYYQFDEGIGQVMNTVDTTANGINNGGIYEQLYNYDVAILTLDSPVSGVISYSASEPVSVTVANLGATDITTDFDVSYVLNGGTPVTVTVPAGTTTLAANTTTTVNFSPVDLSFSGVHNFTVYTSLSGDDYSGNDTLDQFIYQQNNTLGD
ncbi:MAG: LamG domain-containing protein, partial [Crocinitomicaceae bacterium]|nr:LamG domain-containing protein [Crocinitomicaceae bacterium]